MAIVIDGGLGDVLNTLLADTTEPTLIVDPTSPLIEALVDTAIALSPAPTLRVLATEAVLKDAVADFLVASNAAELVADDTLSLHVADTEPGNELVVTPSSLGAIVTAATETAALTTADSDFVQTVYDHYTDSWDAAPGFTLRTPPRSTIRETLRTSISPGVEADFTALLDSLETARGNGEGLDEVTISLLVAAKNNELLYDISKWGEDVGIASKATFSRTKTTLEELGLIDTEKVPIDVGRPRLRLKFAHEQLKNASANELAGVAQGILH